LLVKGQHIKLPRKDKKRHNNQIINLNELTDWEAEITQLLNDIEEYKESCVKDSIAVYHDITPTISLIFRTLESLIADVPGANFDEKVDNSDIKHRTLYHAINLLDNRLKMMPLISNPEAAKFGLVSRCSPYKIFDKVRRLFNDSANKRGITLDLQSSTYITSEPQVYDSFITIPFVLVENAIKYSVNNGTVHILLRQKGKNVLVSVTSFGPVVTTENHEKIFEKGFKDPNAKKFASQGSGIGLYLANLVANAHNFEIFYKKGSTKIEKGIEIGSNTFSFQLND
jgi:K+-sensing histidine kinase KdpD